MLIGWGSILLAPSGHLPSPSLRITLPPENATQAIGFYFSHISRDFNRSVDKIRNQKQLELGLNCERPA